MAASRAIEHMKRHIIDNVRGQLTTIAQSIPSKRDVSSEMTNVDETDFSDDIVSFFGGAIDAPNTVGVSEGRVEEELQWLIGEAPVAAGNVLKFWRQQAESSNYKLLPPVRRCTLVSRHPRRRLRAASGCAAGWLPPNEPV